MIKTIEDLKECPECKSKRLKSKYGSLFKKCQNCKRLYAVIHDKLNIWDEKIGDATLSNGWIDYDKWENKLKEKVIFT